MIRVWTYLTLDPFSVPIDAEVSYDLSVCELDMAMGNTNIVQPLRDGRTFLTFDPKRLYEVSGVLMMLSADIDRKSNAIYDGYYRYIGNNLFNHYRDHLPIIVMHYGTNGITAKAYACYLVAVQDDFAAQAIDDDTSIMKFQRVNRQKVTSFNLHVWLSGTFTDIDDIDTIIWENRASDES